MCVINQNVFLPEGAAPSLPIISPIVQQFAARTRREGLCTKTGSASLSRASSALKDGSFLKKNQIHLMNTSALTDEGETRGAATAAT